MLLAAAEPRAADRRSAEIIEGAGHADIGVRWACARDRVKADPPKPFHMGLRPGVRGVVGHLLVVTEQMTGDEASRRADVPGRRDEDVGEILHATLALRKGLSRVGILTGWLFGHRDVRVDRRQKIVKTIKAVIAPPRHIGRVAAQIHTCEGERRFPQKHLNGKPLQTAAQHPAGVRRLHLPDDRQAQPLNGAVDVEGVRDVAESVLAGLEPRIGVRLHPPERDVLPVIRPWRGPQDLHRRPDRLVIRVLCGLMDMYAHASLQILFGDRHTEFGVIGKVLTDEFVKTGLEHVIDAQPVHSGERGARQFL